VSASAGSARSLGWCSCQRVQIGAFALPEDNDDLQIEVNVIDSKLRHLGQTEATVNHHPEQGKIPSVVKVFALTRLEQLAEIAITDNWHRDLRQGRGLHPVHWVRGRFPLVHAPVEELAQIPITDVGRLWSPTAELIGNESLDMPAC